MIPLLVMITLHSGSGTPLDVNTATITNLRNPEPSNNGALFSKGVQCQINMVDGKYIAVRETCAEVRKLMDTTK
jgi:hypothetical protein